MTIEENVICTRDSLLDWDKKIAILKKKAGINYRKTP